MLINLYGDFIDQNVQLFPQKTDTLVVFFIAAFVVPFSFWP